MLPPAISTLEWWGGYDIDDPMLRLKRRRRGCSSGLIAAIAPHLVFNRAWARAYWGLMNLMTAVLWFQKTFHLVGRFVVLSKNPWWIFKSFVCHTASVLDLNCKNSNTATLS